MTLHMTLKLHQHMNWNAGKMVLKEHPNQACWYWISITSIAFYYTVKVGVSILFLWQNELMYLMYWGSKVYSDIWISFTFKFAACFKSKVHLRKNNNCYDWDSNLALHNVLLFAFNWSKSLVMAWWNNFLIYIFLALYLYAWGNWLYIINFMCDSSFSWNCKRNWVFLNKSKQPSINWC